MLDALTLAKTSLSMELLSNCHRVCEKLCELLHWLTWRTFQAINGTARKNKFCNQGFADMHQWCCPDSRTMQWMGALTETPFLSCSCQSKSQCSSPCAQLPLPFAVPLQRGPIFLMLQFRCMMENIVHSGLRVVSHGSWSSSACHAVCRSPGLSAFQPSVRSHDVVAGKPLAWHSTTNRGGEKNSISTSLHPSGVQEGLLTTGNRPCLRGLPRFLDHGLCLALMWGTSAPLLTIIIIWQLNDDWWLRFLLLLDRAQAFGSAVSWASEHQTEAVVITWQLHQALRVRETNRLHPDTSACWSFQWFLFASHLVEYVITQIIRRQLHGKQNASVLYEANVCSTASWKQPFKPLAKPPTLQPTPLPLPFPWPGLGQKEGKQKVEARACHWRVQWLCLELCPNQQSRETEQNACH